MQPVTLTYPMIITPDTHDTFTVKFVDIPEAHTNGVDYKDALINAQDAFETALEFYFEDGRRIPLASTPEEGQAMLNIGIELSEKILAWNLTGCIEFNGKKTQEK